MEAQEVKELWDEYRVAKCFPNLTELLMRKIGTEFLPELNQEGGYDDPPPGSIYYVEQVSPPGWFIDSLKSDNIISPIEMATPTEKPSSFKDHKKKKKRRH